MFGISVSKKRNRKPVTYSIGNDITLTSWGAIKVFTTHFFPSGFRVKTDSIVIYIDPVEIDSNEQADFIFITHSHPDHFSKKNILKLSKSTTKVICAGSVAKKLKNIQCEVLKILPGELMNFENVKIEAIPAYNTKPKFFSIKAHPKEKANVGFVLNLDKIRIYHTGDTDLVPEMVKIENINTLLVPIGGDNLTMDEEAAALLTCQIHPQRVVPMHYKLKKQKKLDIFNELIDQSIEVLQFTGIDSSH